MLLSVFRGFGKLPNKPFSTAAPQRGRAKIRKWVPASYACYESFSLLSIVPEMSFLPKNTKRKTPQSATLQSLYINKNEGTLFPRFVVVGFLYSSGSSRQDFQIFFTHTVKHGIELTAARGLLLFPFREKELVY